MAAVALSSAVVAPAGAPVPAAVRDALADAGWAVTELADPTDGSAAAAAVAEADAQAPLALLLIAPPVEGSLPFDDLTPERWSATLTAHLAATRTAARAALPAMLAHGRGNILCVTSSLAQVGGDQHAHVAAAQGAVHGLVRALGQEVAPRGVSVNAIAPDPDGDVAAQVVPVVRFLVDEPHFIVGQVLAPSDGAVL